jgi:hypothetical protein
MVLPGMAGDILNIVPGLQATSVAMNAMPKGLMGSNNRSKVKGQKVNYLNGKAKKNGYGNSTKTMVGGMVGTMVGVGLTGATAKMIGGL